MSLDQKRFRPARNQRSLHGLPSGSTGARSLRQARAAGSTLGTGFLGVGAATIAAGQAVYGLARFITQLPDYPTPVPAAAAWILYLVAFVGTVTLVAVQGERLTGRVMIGLAAVLLSVALLDLIAIWPLHDPGRYATASISVGYGLLPLATLRPARELLIATTALLALLVAAIACDIPLSPAIVSAQLPALTQALIPPATAVFVIQRFRLMVQRELDRVLVQSTITQPRLAVGMLASDELARLDLAAEKLLSGVASDAIPLPLAPKVASRAASLATELRLHLIEGRRETWLYHAVTESEHLGRAVTLSDPSSLAGLLTREQRDGLLQAVWLLLGDRGSRAAATSITVTLGPIRQSIQNLAGRTIEVPIELATTGIRRNRVAPPTWTALSRVGEYSSAQADGTFRLLIRCLVDNPAET